MAAKNTKNDTAAKTAAAKGAAKAAKPAASTTTKLVWHDLNSNDERVAAARSAIRTAGGGHASAKVTNLKVSKDGTQVKGDMPSLEKPARNVIASLTTAAVPATVTPAAAVLAPAAPAAPVPTPYLCAVCRKVSVTATETTCAECSKLVAQGVAAQGAKKAAREAAAQAPAVQAQLDAEAAKIKHNAAVATAQTSVAQEAAKAAGGVVATLKPLVLTHEQVDAIKAARAKGKPAPDRVIVELGKLGTAEQVAETLGLRLGRVQRVLGEAANGVTFSETGVARVSAAVWQARLVELAKEIQAGTSQGSVEAAATQLAYLVRQRFDRTTQAVAEALATPKPAPTTHPAVAEALAQRPDAEGLAR